MKLKNYEIMIIPNRMFYSWKFITVGCPLKIFSMFLNLKNYLSIFVHKKFGLGKFLAHQCNMLDGHTYVTFCLSSWTCPKISNPVDASYSLTARLKSKHATDFFKKKGDGFISRGYYQEEWVQLYI